ncbi:MAG: Fic family protein [Candidatus Competibacteraceae bacterium]|nr:Fic family protein [Candidatus Competibacteraceae bacterium]MCB1807267.1 Fic family protein [Candidatus Competibacteraceae bacterium]
MESPQHIEPCFLETIPLELTDFIAALSQQTSLLGSRLHPKTAANLASLVRVMNCYYSNLIEGHNTTPLEIEKALANELANDENRRNLQIEARAHIRLQQHIDDLHANQELPEPASVGFICDLHRRFYDDASAAMLSIDGAGRTFTMTPGQFRNQPEHDVSVGRHVPPSSQHVEAFMRYFAQRYQFARLGLGQRLLAVASAHHRLNYIHPFPDGNGRVSRLMSHAMALQAGIGAHGLWSISRGLARGLESRTDYKRMMDYADTPRQGDLDGRGNLSHKALTEFTAWFLKVCIDQVEFMSTLFDLEHLANRLEQYAMQQGLKPESRFVLREVLQRGELQRGDIPRVSGLKERTARDLLSNLINDGILASETPKGPVSLRFPVKALDTLFPKLYPAT